ncbi:MAG: glutaminyl-peptide cyclotransferase [Bacteroidales bacterium]
MKYILKILVISFAVLGSCTRPDDKKEDKSKETDKEEPKKQERVTNIKIEDPKSEYKTGDEIRFQFQYPDTIKLDSIRMDINNNQAKVFYKNKEELSTKNLPVGNNNFRFIVFLENREKEVLHKRLEFKSDIKPSLSQCEIIETYPHDPKAYTQGLFYEDGYLYEGTGQKGESSLRKIDLEKGEIISSRNLPSQYFGEGITSYQDKIIQLTWTSRVGFIYDKNEFKLLKKVRYPTEGWGITSDGDKLFMSDGSSKIYLLDPQDFSEIGRMEIYDHEGAVDNLNELEYIDGKIYANVWQQDYIISFEPDNGKVLEKIDCSQLVPEQYKNHNDYVLNGIAYDVEKDRLLLTGKRWPKIYHVEFVE